MPFVPGHLPQGRGPLLWKQTTQGLLLQNVTTPDSLPVHSGSCITDKQIVAVPYEMGHVERKGTAPEIVRDLSRTIMLDTLRTCCLTGVRPASFCPQGI